MTDGPLKRRERLVGRGQPEHAGDADADAVAADVIP